MSKEKNLKKCLMLYKKGQKNLGFVVGKEKLLKSLQLAGDIISDKNSMAILSNCLLEVIDNGLWIVSTDLEMSIKVRLDIENVMQGSITVFAKKFIEIVRELPDDDIEISLNDKEYLEIYSKSKEIKAKFKIKTISKDDYPVLPEFKKEKNFIIPQNTFRDMIRKTIFSVSQDELQGTISGIKMELKNKKLKMVATDARRLALIDFKLNTDVEIEEVIVPWNVLVELLKILTEEGDVEIGIGKNQIHFKIDNIELLSVLIDGKFPDYKQVIPAKFEKKIILPAQKILSAIKRVSVMVIGNQNSMMKDIVKLNFIKDNLEITTNNPDVGEAKEIVSISSSLENFEIAFSSEFLLDAFKAMDTEKVIISFNENTQAALLKEENNEDYICLIMPIRIDK